jgi:hypothetical protein
MNLHEQIYRINNMMGFLCEDYDPSGKKVKPKRYIIHKSEYTNRDAIKKKGLKPKVGFCYKNYTGEKKCRPAVFATNSDNPNEWFATMWDSDVWEIDTRKIPDVVWYKDTHRFPNDPHKHIVTFDEIPPSALTLIHKGKE